MLSPLLRFTTSLAKIVKFCKISYADRWFGQSTYKTTATDNVEFIHLLVVCLF